MSDGPGSSASTELWLVRHGETEWSRARRHTSVTDLPLTAEGTSVAEQLRERLAGEAFERVVTSPRLRARDTARLAGFPEAEVCAELVEWAYGSYEGITTTDIRQQVPDWTVWTHPIPGGETAGEVATRMDQFLAGVGPGRTLVFGHGHALRALTARWLGLDVSAGRLFRLDTATISTLGFEREQPVILAWNR
ncbi:MAG: histidine phosphatase family protein [Nocardioides sp.]